MKQYGIMITIVLTVFILGLFVLYHGLNYKYQINTYISEEDKRQNEIYKQKLQRYKNRITKKEWKKIYKLTFYCSRNKQDQNIQRQCLDNKLKEFFNNRK